MKSSRSHELSGHRTSATRDKGARFAVLAAAAGVILAGVATVAYPWARGYALYHGHLPLSGRIAGHDDDLPSAASRCSNCHDAVTGGAQTKRLIAPLNGTALTQPVSRRGGPQFIYTEASFCSFLRDGVDAVFVQASRTMPRFTVSDGECHALWTYVISR